MKLPVRVLAGMVLLCGLDPESVTGQEMIDVGGGRLEMRRSGEGSPAVIFEDGVGDPRWWDLFSKPISEFTMVVGYSHAGIGKSEPTPGPRSASKAVGELHTLLERAGVRPPYILVGHSMGGLFARVFAMTYPTEIAGLVLVDAVHERQVIEFTHLDSVGFTRRRQLGLAGLEPGQKAEMDGLAGILARGDLGIPGKVPDVPMVVLTALNSASAIAPGASSVWRGLQSELFQSTTSGMHIVSSRSGHNFREEPDLVIHAIRWVFDAVQARGQATPAPAPRTSIALDGAVLARYVGVYELTPGFSLTVTLQGGELWVQGTDQPKVRALAISEREFAFKEIDARLTFQTNADGSVTGLVLHNNGQDRPGKRIQ